MRLAVGRVIPSAIDCIAAPRLSREAAGYLHVASERDHHGSSFFEVVTEAIALSPLECQYDDIVWLARDDRPHPIVPDAWTPVRLAVALGPLRASSCSAFQRKGTAALQRSIRFCRRNDRIQCDS